MSAIKRLAPAIPLFVLTFIVYIVFSGGISRYDVVTGIFVSVVVAVLFSRFALTNPGKALNPVRWFWAIVYCVYYFFVAEVKSHLDVMARILHPKTPVKPGIVKVPYGVSTDYAVTAVACSITNTPGTVVIDVDPEKKVYYVHWIDVKTLKPEEARLHISASFERFCKKIFD